jgi:hypothetical protein
MKCLASRSERTSEQAVGRSCEEPTETGMSGVMFRQLLLVEIRGRPRLDFDSEEKGFSGRARVVQPCHPAMPVRSANNPCCSRLRNAGNLDGRRRRSYQVSIFSLSRKYPATYRNSRTTGSSTAAAMSAGARRLGRLCSMAMILPAVSSLPPASDLNLGR